MRIPSMPKAIPSFLPARLALAALLLCGGGARLSAKSLDVDAGLRAAIFNDAYKLGIGAELGAIQNLNPRMDAGLHLNYTFFRNKTEGLDDVSELGGYLTLYFLPTLADQPFELRLGPHIGGARIEQESFLDVGGDVSAVFQVAPMTRFYAAFVPSYFIGEENEGMIRIGFGVTQRIGE